MVGVVVAEVVCDEVMLLVTVLVGEVVAEEVAEEVGDAVTLLVPVDVAVDVGVEVAVVVADVVGVVVGVSGSFTVMSTSCTVDLRSASSSAWSVARTPNAYSPASPRSMPLAKVSSPVSASIAKKPSGLLAATKSNWSRLFGDVASPSVAFATKSSVPAAALRSTPTSYPPDENVGLTSLTSVTWTVKW